MQAKGLRDLQLPMLLPGITATTGPDDYQAFKMLQLHRFDGNSWIPLGAPVRG